MGFSVKDMIFGTVGGLGLFLFGMGMLSEGLKQAAGARLRRLLHLVTRWPLTAFGIGAAVTCLIQSSSATTVMVVGLINAGLLTLRQAICVVLGANVGTTMTAWLVAGMSALKVTNYALPSVTVGLLLTLLGKKQRTRSLGQILLGFGILFLGIWFMKEAFAPLRTSPGAMKVLVAVGHNPILAVLAGACLTMLLQSSSASIAMIQVLAASGAMGTDWDAALAVSIPFILGDNIGTTVTAQIAALRTNPSGRRAAMAHTLFNVLGVTAMLPLVYAGLYVPLVKLVAPVAVTQKTVMLHIAISHTLFNVTNSLLFLPLVGVLEKLVTRIIPVSRREVALRPVTLERHLLNTPTVALQQVRSELVRMAQTAKEAVENAAAGLCDDDRSRLGRVEREEQAVDSFQTEITRYLVELSQRHLSPEAANELPVLLHTVNDIERVSDHAVNITEIAARKIDEREAFSPAAQVETRRLRDTVEEMFRNVLAAVENSDFPAAERALACESQLNEMQREFRWTHVRRLGEGACSPIAGLIFVDFVDNMEKIGDHLTNIAQGVLAGLQWNGKDARASAPAGQPAER